MLYSEVFLLFLRQPDVVAPGYAILAPHPTGIPLNCEGNPMFADITIDSGTSYACAQVAAYALKVFSRHPDWMPSAIKSALITTGNQNNYCYKRSWLISEKLSMYQLRQPSCIFLSFKDGVSFNFTVKLNLLLCSYFNL